MLGIEAYIGSYEIINGKYTLEQLDTDTQTNLEQICELVNKVFEAYSCSILANYPDKAVTLSKVGQDIEFLDPAILKSEFSEHIFSQRLTSLNADPECQTTIENYRVIAPVILPSNLLFGWLVFDRESHDFLSKKEKSIVNVLQRDIANHLVQRRMIFEKAKAFNLQENIAKLNQDLIFIKDKDFKIVYANDAFLSLYPEHMRKKIIGYTTVEEYEPNEVEVFLAQDKIAFEIGISEIVEDLHMPNGKHIIVETVKQRFEDEFGNAYILGVCREVTEKAKLISQLQKANSELADFTSVASHDLKSPLNAIKRLLDWIADDCADILPAEHLENFNLIMSRADRMKTLLDDLLNYAKLNSQDVTIADIRLSDVYYDVLALLDIPEKTTISINSGNNVVLSVPLVPFKTVLLNLLNNAIKHNDKEYGVIEIHLKESRHYHIISVIDNGPGIEPKYFSRIFQLFQTLRSRDDVEGSGMGLSVVGKIVNNFGGRVEVLSDGKNGSIFNVFWPIKGN